MIFVKQTYVANPLDKLGDICNNIDNKISDSP